MGMFETALEHFHRRSRLAGMRAGRQFGRGFTCQRSTVNLPPRNGNLGRETQSSNRNIAGDWPNFEIGNQAVMGVLRVRCRDHVADNPH